jgi:hypothetical protein
MNRDESNTGAQDVQKQLSSSKKKRKEKKY